MSTRVPVLLVDDNPTKRLALKSILLPLGYAIVEADSGLAALRCVMAQDFAVILLDVCMPGMDGFETAALIRQRRQSEMTPIIFITAFGNDDIVTTDRYAEGAVDFIFAPVPPAELRAKVSVFANLFSRAEALAAKARVVQQSADQLRLLTDAAPIGIFQTDIENRYVYTNPRWTEITGMSAQDAAGQRWDTIIAAVADGDAELGRRFEIRVPGGEPRIVLLTSKRIPDRDGGTAGWVGTLADVTAEAGAESAMSDARDKATDASRLKSDFLANMSHEIRTPMNGVIGMTDLLLETNLDARQRDYAQTVRNSGEALLTVINDILDFTKVEAGKLEIEDLEFDLRSIVDDVVDLLASSAQAKRLELVAVVDGTVPSLVFGDPGRVRQVLTNLVGNAIKFTQTGEVVVRVSRLGASPTDVGDRKQAVIRFEVADTGVGIEPEKLAAVFQPFVQADTSTSRKYGGTGLGLAISSHLVSLMGGDCGVASEPDQGSTFWFTIAVRAESGQPTYGSVARDVDLEGVAALIVDDNDTQLSVLSEFMSDWGMVVTTAHSGEAALKAMRSASTRGEPFAVALLDRSMPGMDGLELTNAIVMEPALTARLVLISSLGEEENLGVAADCGIFASVAKPVRKEELHACLRRVLGLFVPEAPAATDSPPSGAPATGRLLLAEDNLINQRVAVAMLTSAGYEVDTVLDGAAAVAASAAAPYDAILMDCQMPELNGYEATAAIRAREGTDHHTPIIALTAGARREDRDRCLAEGMDSYLAKPVSKEALLALVGRCVQHDHEIGAPMSRIGHAPQTESTIDTEVFDELRMLAQGLDRDLVADLVDAFLLDTDVRLVELRAGIERGDAAVVGRIAHQIKGGGAQLGGHRLASSCGRLEQQAAAGALSGALIDLREVELDYEELSYALKAQSVNTERPGDCDMTG